VDPTPTLLTAIVASVGEVENVDDNSEDTSDQFISIQRFLLQAI